VSPANAGPGLPCHGQKKTRTDEPARGEVSDAFGAALFDGFLNLYICFAFHGHDLVGGFGVAKRQIDVSIFTDALRQISKRTERLILVGTFGHSVDAVCKQVTLCKIQLIRR